MACTTCNEDNSDVRTVCRVCELINGDTAIKRVKWCKECKAYICMPHRKDYFARGMAALKNIFD